MVNDFTSEDLKALTAECSRETSGTIQDWRIIFHRNGPDGKSSGELTLQFSHWVAGYGVHYRNYTIREADHQSAQHEDVHQ